MPSLCGPCNFVLEEQAYFGPSYQHTPGRGAVLAATPAASSTPSPGRTEPCCWPGQHMNRYGGHGRGSSTACGGPAPAPLRQGVGTPTRGPQRAGGCGGPGGCPVAVPTQPTELPEPPGCGTEPWASRSVGLVAGLAVTHPSRSVLLFSPHTFLFFSFFIFFF